MLFLLLRLLTTLPTQQVPAEAIAAPVVAIAHPRPPAGAAALREARAQLATVEGAPARIRMFMRGAQDDAYRASCVAQRLAEAQVHVALARAEMRELTALGRTADDQAHSSTRLTLLTQRTREVEHAARLCVDTELSSVSAVKVEVEVPEAVQRRGDQTSPPPPPTACPGTSCTVVPWPP
jgi:hypothetical protein